MITSRLVLASAFLFVTVASADVIFSDPGTPFIDANNVTLYGNLQSTNGDAGRWSFEYGTDTNYGSITSSSGSLAANATVTDASLSITGLQPSTTYHYRYRALINVGAVGIKLGTTDYTFTTAAAAVAAPDPPTISAKLLSVGSSATLGLSATGVRPFTSQWSHNGVPTGSPYTGTGVAFNLNPVALTDAGVWSCSVTNTVNSVDHTVQSSDVTIAVADVTKFGTGVAAVEGGTITATVTVMPAGTVATYNWKLVGGTLTGIGNVSGQGTNKLTVSNVTPAADATYECEVTVGSDTVTLSAGRAIIAKKPAIDPISAQTLRVGQAANIAVIVTPNATSATTVVKGLPTGLNYSASLNAITGAAFTPTLLDEPLAITVESTNTNGKSTLVFPLVINALDSALVGQFDAFIPRDGDIKNLGGKLTLKTTAVGTVTGSITFGAAVYKINAKLVGGAGNTASLSIPALASGKSPTLNVTLNFAGSSLSGSIVTATGTSILNGGRSSWNAFNPVAVPGLFNCYFTPENAMVIGTTHPRGDSIAALTIGSTGSVSLSGRMADGTVIVASTFLSDAGEVPLSIVLYAGLGSVLGKLAVSGRSVSNFLTWYKAAKPGRSYASGFASHMLTCAGYRYVKPSAALGQIFLGLSSGANNAHISFSDVDPVVGINQVFTVTNLSAAVMPTGALNPNAVKVTINATSGQVNGTFKLSDLSGTRLGTFYGIAYTGASPNKAYGCFLLPVSGAANSAIASSEAVLGN